MCIRDRYCVKGSWNINMRQYKFKDNKMKWINPEQVKVTKFNLSFNVHLVDAEKFPNTVYKHDNISTEKINDLYEHLWKNLSLTTNTTATIVLLHVTFPKLLCKLKFWACQARKNYAVVKDVNVTNSNYNVVGCVFLICQSQFTYYETNYFSDYRIVSFSFMR